MINQNNETEPEPADSKADSNIEVSARQPSAKTDDMKQDRRTADRADSNLRIVGGPSAASGKSGEEPETQDRKDFPKPEGKSVKDQGSDQAVFIDPSFCDK